MKLSFNYNKKSQIDDNFWKDKSGDFDKDDESHVKEMIIYLKNTLKLDEYAIKRLECCIKTELPFFASKRYIARKWLEENFNM